LTQIKTSHQRLLIVVLAGALTELAMLDIAIAGHPAQATGDPASKIT
jgi:hypothetical protein